MKSIWNIVESVSDFPSENDWKSYEGPKIRTYQDTRPEDGIQLVWVCPDMIDSNIELIKKVYANDERALMSIVDPKGICIVIDRNRYGMYNAYLCITCKRGCYPIPQCFIGQFSNEKIAKKESFNFFKQFKDETKFVNMLNIIADKKTPINTRTKL